MAAASGLLLVDKPVGPTSRDLVNDVQRLLTAPGRRRARGAPRFRVGHAGTLDPAATGLLLILVGRATRLTPFLVGLDKVYEAEVRLGVGTDTLDREGAVTASADVPQRPDGLESALAGLRGEIEQIPPVYSAIKRGGRSLHHMARSGLDVAPPPARRVTIHELRVDDVAWGREPTADDLASLEPAPDGRIYALQLTVACSSGTYVRSLARDLATALGTVGHLHGLRRTQVGPFAVGEAVPGGDLGDAAAVTRVIRPLAAALPHLPVITLQAEHVARLRRGAKLEASWLAGAAVDGQVRLVAPDGGLVAVARPDPETGAAVLAAVFPDAEPEEDPTCG